jgi:O-antigen/teichoic acid export membrane protein
VSGFVLLFCFHVGGGIYSMVWSGLAGMLVSGIFLAGQCVRLRLLPTATGWGRVSGKYFREMFSYGRDLFLVSAGVQFVVASQTMIITAQLGLEEAARWGVGLRVFNLIGPLVSRVATLASPAFSEMLARGEMAKLRARFMEIVAVSATAGGLAAVAFAVSNRLFVQVWMRGEVAWSMECDVCLAVCLVVQMVNNCNLNLILITRQIGFIRFLYLCEAGVFVMSAWWVSRWAGLIGVIACAGLCSLCISGVCGVWRISRYLALPVGQILGGWFRPLGKVLMFFAPVMIFGWWGSLLLPDIWRLGCLVLFGGSVGGIVFWRLGLTARLREDLLARTPALVQRWARLAGI